MEEPTLSRAEQAGVTTLQHYDDEEEVELHGVYLCLEGRNVTSGSLRSP